MQLVADANIFIAAFLKDAKTRELLLDERLTLVTPEYGLIETRKILEEPKILKRLGLSAENFDRLWSILTSRIEVITGEEYRTAIGEAQELIADPKDIPYLACALKLGVAIWTNDPDFQVPELKARVPILTTGELIERLNR